MRWSIRILGALAVPAWLLFSTQTGLAQPPAEDSDTGDEVAPVPAASDALANRVRELEARDEAREQRMNAALERVAQLERDAIQAAAHAAEEQAAADAAAAAEAEADAAEPEEESSFPEIRPLASMVTRFERREGYTQLGRRAPGCVPGDSDCLRYRARVGIEIPNLRVSDDVIALVRFLPQVTGNWAGDTAAPTSGGTNVPTVGMYEGFLSLNIAQTVRVDIGRFSMAYGEHLIIGTLGWHPAARSFDGARMRIQPDEDGIWVDAFWTLVREGGLDTFGDFDRSFYGLYAGLGSAIGEGVELDVYALGLQENNSVDMVGAQVPWTLRVILGSRFRYRVGMVDMRAEGALQTGRQGRPGADPSLILAGNIDAEIGLNFADNRFRVGVEGVFASGDDPTTDNNEANANLFPTGHAWLGLMDVTGARTNIGSGVLHLMAKPHPQLVIKLDTHIFMRPEAAAGVGGTVDNFLGGEGDLNIIWTPGAGFRVRGLYGLFIPNGGYTPNNPSRDTWGPGTDPVHYIEVELSYTLN